MGNQRLTQTQATEKKPLKPTRVSRKPQEDGLEQWQGLGSNRAVNEAIGQYSQDQLPQTSQNVDSTFRGLFSEIGGVSQPQSLVIQPKLVIGQPNDKYEQEANMVAHQITNKMAPLSSSANWTYTQESSGSNSPSLLQVKSIKQTGVHNNNISNNLEERIRREKGQGQLLPEYFRMQMEEALSTDFSEVKVHSNAKAHALNVAIQSRAFATGEDIFFRQGEYDPTSRTGSELLAHELVHIAQQRCGRANIVQKQEEENLERGSEDDLEVDHEIDAELEEAYASGKDIDELDSDDEACGAQGDNELDEQGLERGAKNQENTEPLVVQTAAKMVGYFTSHYARKARHIRSQGGVGGRNIATAKVRVIGAGGVIANQYINKLSKGRHSEARLKRKIDKLVNHHGVGNVQVVWIYTELEPCGSDCHNCRQRLRNWFGNNTKIRYSIQYTNTGFGVSSAKAKARRRRAVNTLKRFQTKLVQHAQNVQEQSFHPPLVRVNSTDNVTKGRKVT